MRPTPPRRERNIFVRYWDGLWAAFYGVFWLGIVLGILLCRLFS